MLKPVSVKALPQYRIRVQYSDGVLGEVDLSHPVGKGIFARWKEPGEFEKVHLGEGRSIAWSDQIDLCGDALYLQITGKRPEDIFPARKPADVNA